MAELVKELAVKIVQVLGLLEVNPAELGPETTFFDDGLGLDSVDILELAVMLDRDYGVVIDNRDVGEKVFVNLGTLAEFVRQSQAGAA
ncbi:MAG: acyl carrier protein [Deltaproteobacteria bacterium]|nr:acyl carrier protein [Deltaproteobacteria bacterium]